MDRRFVDCHSHVVPSDDDGASTIPDGLALCRSAAEHGTAVLFATPHVWPYFTLSAEREAAIRAAFDRMRPYATLELRLGFELTPAVALLEEDPHRYALEGTDCVLMEVPFSGPPDVLFALAEHVEGAGLRPVIAHPERTEAVLADPKVAEDLGARGWALQVNATSLLGRHGPEPEELGWSLLESGLGKIVASDGHRVTRPAHLDEAYAQAEQLLGERALSLFDGSVLGVMPSQTASRAESRGA
ncbi:MAG: protein-tyrosine phosphatase [Gaiellaceae bacterium]|nr:protein-tyrosine phosphatase [Gaiellaceae bacterium]